MNRNDYMDAMEKIKASTSLKKRIFDARLEPSAGNTKSERKHPRYSFRKVLIATFVLVMCLFSTLVYAGIIDLSQIYKTIFPDNTGYIEQYIQPITSDSDETNNETDTTECVSNGIRIKLISAINDNNALQLFATATDMTGNRLSEESRFDDWGFSQGHGGNISVIDYKDTTKTATLLITSLGENLQGQSNLTIRGFASNRHFYKNQAENNINLYELLQEDSATVLSQEEVFVSGGGVQNQEDELIYKTTDVLGFEERSDVFDTIDWCKISNIGFIDGYLHIQTQTMSDNQNDLASITLVNNENETSLRGHLFLSYASKEHQQTKNNLLPYPIYKDMIYKGITSPEQLKDLSITIDYMEEGQIVTGDWSFSFNVPNKATTNIKITKEITLNENKIAVDTVWLSPFGLSFSLEKDDIADYQYADNVSITYHDNTVVLLKEITMTGYNGETMLTFGGKVIEVEKIKSITVNDEIITVNGS